MRSEVPPSPPPTFLGLGSRTLALLVFLFALGVRVGYAVDVRTNPNGGHFNFFLVQGSPFGDARSWHTIGVRYAEGRPAGFWEGRRPVYGVLLAMIYLWTGPAYEVAVALNVLAGAGTAVLLYYMMTRCFGARVGLATAFWYSLSPMALTCCCLTLTETLGAFLLAWHLWSFMKHLGATPSFAGLGGSGVLFGLSNVVRTMTALALPVDVVAAPLICWRDGARFWRGIFAAVALGLGATLILLPAMAYNQVQNGIFTLSDNTSLDLFAATAPEYGMWSPAVDKLADDAGMHTTKERYDFFLEKAKANLRDHWRLWVTRIADLSARIGRNLAHLSAWAFIGWGAAFAASCLARPSWRSLAAIIVVLPLLGTGAFAFWRDPALSAPESLLHLRTAYVRIALFAACLSIVRSLFLQRNDRRVVVSILLVMTVLSLAMFGQGEVVVRFYIMFDWAFIGLLLGELDRWGRRLAFGREPARGFERPEDAPPLVPPAIYRWIAAATIVWAAASLAILGYRGYLDPPAPQAFEPVAAADARAILERVKADAPDVLFGWERSQADPANLFTLGAIRGELEESNGKLAIWKGRVLPEIYYFPEGSQTNAYWRCFYLRRYERTVIYFRVVPMPGWTAPTDLEVVFPGDLRPLKGKDVVLLARMNTNPDLKFEGTIAEGIAIAPIDQATGRADLARMIEGYSDPVHREVLRALAGNAPRTPTVGAPPEALEAARPTEPANDAPVLGDDS